MVESLPRLYEALYLSSYEQSLIVMVGLLLLCISLYNLLYSPQCSIVEN